MDEKILNAGAYSCYITDVRVDHTMKREYTHDGLVRDSAFQVDRLHLSRERLEQSLQTALVQVRDPHAEDPQAL